MDKIVLRYKGGLGNQMFIYAMQLALEKHYPGAEILADTTRYLLHNEHNGYELPSVWGIEPTEADRETLKKVSPYLVPSAWMLHSPKLVKDYICNNWQYKYYESRRQERSVAEHYYRQADHYTYDPEIWNLGKNGPVMYLDGLWQNMEYFAGVETEIRKAFCLNINGQGRFEDRYTDYDKEIRKQITAAGDRSVSIHVRRGDFTGSKFDICGPGYYEAAIKRMALEESQYKTSPAEPASDQKTGDLQYFIFTDDTSYVSSQFRDLQGAVFVNHDAAHSFLDMDLMSRCRHHIVSNSTFAWWGAYLAGSRENGTKSGECGITIAPKYSLCRNGEYTPLSAPEDWIQIEI